MELGQVMNTLRGPRPYVFYTVAELLTVWPRDDAGAPRGPLAIAALRAEEFLASADYRDFGARLLAARAGQLPASEELGFGALVAAVVEVATRSRDSLVIFRTGDPQGKLLAFWSDGLVAELVLEGEGFGVRLGESDQPAVDLIGTYLDGELETAYVEWQSEDRRRVGVAWGRGSGFELRQHADDWQQASAVKAADAASWMRDRLLALNIKVKN